MKIVLTQDDGSTVDFLDPAGVQIAVDAAVASLAPTEGDDTVVEVDVIEADGDVQKFKPEE